MSKTKERLPIAVTNLRKIWDQKKREMEITQIEAADKLGWTQGAFSQYLNGITELGPSAVIKLANFFSVDPIDIDPNIGASLPQVKRAKVDYALNDATKRINEAYEFNLGIYDDFIRIKLDSDYVVGKFTLRKGTIINCLPYPPKQYVPRNTESTPIFAAQVKGYKRWHIYFEDALPPKSEIKKLLLILGFTLY